MNLYYPCNYFISKFKERFSAMLFLYRKYLTFIVSCTWAYTNLCWSQVSLLFFFFFLQVCYNNWYKCSCLWNVILILEMDNIIKILILFGKYHIHTAKFMSVVPNGRLFSTVLTLQYWQRTIAVKTSLLLKKI